jgi:hypothetical protein
MNRSIMVVAALAAVGCGPRQHSMQTMQSPASTPLPAPYEHPNVSPAVREGFARVRAATEKFKVLDSAVAVGYARDVPRCFSDQHHGAMGYHHVNRNYLDTLLEVERPEILLYERHPDGRYELNGVEYIVPYRVWPRDSAAPKIMGLELERADDLNLWYMHMWAWKTNPSGLFAPYNPTVRCPVGAGM